MNKQIQEIEALPSMNDFEEGSSLMISEEEETPAAEEEETPAAEEEEPDPEEQEEPVKKEKPKTKAKPKVLEDEEEEEEEPSSSEESEEEESEEETQSSDDFYKEVADLHGIELEVDYGDVDPLTPQGVALREQALAEAAINSQMEFLAKQYPKEFKYLEHAANGGSVDDLIKPGYQDYSKIELKEDDEEQHKKLLKDFYADKGIADNKIARLIEADEDAEGGTYKAAQDVLKERIKTQTERESKQLKEQERLAEEQRKRDDNLRGNVNKIVTSGEVGNFKIPKADQDKFYEYVLQHVQRGNNGSYSFVVPIGDETIGTIMQQAYFTYKGGDISKLVEKKATQVSTQRLKAKVKPTRKKASSSETPPRKGDPSKLGTLDDYTVEE